MMGTGTFVEMQPALHNHRCADVDGDESIDGSKHENHEADLFETTAGVFWNSDDILVYGPRYYVSLRDIRGTVSFLKPVYITTMLMHARVSMMSHVNLNCIPAIMLTYKTTEPT